MENRVEEKGSSCGAGDDDVVSENSEKTKCLDLQSLYKNDVALKEREGVKGNFSGKDDGGKVGDDTKKKRRKKRKRSGKEAALDGFMPIGKKSREGLDEEGDSVTRVVGPGSVLIDTGKSLSESCQKNSLNGNSLNLSENGNLIHIPKRPRGFVGRRKSEVGSFTAGCSSSSACRIGRLNSELTKGEPSGSSTADVGSSYKKGMLVTSSAGNAGNSVAVAGGKDKKLKLVTICAGNAGDSISVAGSGNKKVELTNSAGHVGDLASKAGSHDKKVKLVTSSKGNTHDSISVVGSRDKEVKLVKSSAGSARDPIDLTGSRAKKVKLVTSSAGNAGGSKIKRKRATDEAKEIKNGGVNSALQAKEEGGDAIVNNSDASRMHRSNRRRRKGFPSRTKTAMERVDEPPNDNSARAFDEFHDDDDEENLERNAARMLSSRFDPRCTGFSSKNRTTRKSSESRLSFPGSSDRDFVHRDDSSVNFRSASPNADSRVLRPRHQLKRKGPARKRRHFYEVVASSLDALWFLNQRIKVFWPLDESWYYGLVNEYDPERKLHHVKYDDKEEEWINLHDEKFKILLLPSEVPGRKQRRRSSTRDKSVDKGLKELSEEDGSYAETFPESEPIISWLARPSRRIKSSPSSIKKQKTSHISSQLSSRQIKPVKSADRNGNKSPLTEEGSRHNYGFASRSTDTERVNHYLLGRPSSSKGGTDIVYVRRRSRQKCEGIFPALFRSEEASRQLRTFTSSSPAGADSNLFWSFDDQGLLRLRITLLESVRFKFEMPLPVLPFLNYSFRVYQFWLSGISLLPHYGAIMTTWPEVFLEMLFVDNTVGLRFFLFEVSLKRAVTLFAIILSVFNQPSDEWKFFDAQLPITSIHFRLSSTQDFRRQREFTFYSFSKLRRSKWLYLDSQLHRHCFLNKQLPLSDCTFDNIKSLEGGRNRFLTHSAASAPSQFQKRSLRGMLPMGVSGEYARTRLNYSTCNSTVKLGKVPRFALSFTSAPFFFLGLHLQLLMEHNFASTSLPGNDSLTSSEDSEVASDSIAVELPGVDSCLENIQDIISESCMEISSESLTSEQLSTAEPDSCVGASVTVIDDAKQRNQVLENGKLTIILTSHSGDFEKNQGNASVRTPKCRSDDQEPEQAVAFAAPSVSTTVASPNLSHVQSFSGICGLRVELPSFDQNDKPFDERANIPSQASDLAGNVSDGAAQSPYLTGLRSSWDCDRNGSNASPLGDSTPVWSDGKTRFMRSGFRTGPKKPRTQVRYTLPQGGSDFSSKHKSLNQRSLPYKRIRRSNEKRISDSLKVSEKNLEMLSCDANVLVTLQDKGWRESGACVVLEFTDHNECILAVKVSGVTKYSHKVNHILQPGSTNRYTHAMMWKGGKGWVLEFPDRSQWILFKEIYEKCYNRNIRAASVKNIPIPGVRLVEENDDYATDIPFVRNALKYVRQVESDVEMAINPSHILYDMDSDDERWILRYGKSSGDDENKPEDVSDELFEKTMDMLEKASYSRQQDQFMIDELKDLMVEISSVELVKAIYEHWRQKRQRKGMPLIRHFQPPLWEIYEQQVKEWEEAVARTNTGSSGGCRGKAESIEKPPISAFCRKPRGLELPNRGSKQRSQKRFSVSVHHQAISGDDDRLHSLGKSYELSDISPSLYQSTRLYSPRDAGGINNFLMNGDASEWNHYPKFQGNKLKKNGAFPSPDNSRLVASHSRRTTGMRNGVNRWNMESSDWPSQKYNQYEVPQRYGIQQFDGSDLHEFRLRDASSTAQHAQNLAKLKREKAQRLLFKADLAIQKAAMALMTAEAIKAAAASESSKADTARNTL